MPKNKEDSVKVTFKQFSKIVNKWNEMTAKTPDLAQTKFGYAVKRFFETNSPIVYKDYNLRLSTIRIDNALEDEKTKAVLTKVSNRGFEYNKEGLKNVMKQEQALEDEFENKEFEVVPYFSKDFPKMNDQEVEVFKGFVVQ